MPRQYKLRLGDGTILAVDHASLSSWALDDKAMVQRAGSRRWHPLKALLAREKAVAAQARRRGHAPQPSPAEPPRLPPSPPEPPPPAEPPKAVRLPLVPPPPKRDAAAASPAVPPASLDEPSPPPPAPAPPPKVEVAPPAPKVEEALPAVSLAPLEEAPPAQPPARATPPPRSGPDAPARPKAPARSEKPRPAAPAAPPAPPASLVQDLHAIAETEGAPRRDRQPAPPKGAALDSGDDEIIGFPAPSFDEPRRAPAPPAAASRADDELPAFLSLDGPEPPPPPGVVTAAPAAPPAPPPAAHAKPRELPQIALEPVEEPRPPHPPAAQNAIDEISPSLLEPIEEQEPEQRSGPGVVPLTEPIGPGARAAADRLPTLPLKSLDDETPTRRAAKRRSPDPEEDFEDLGLVALEEDPPKAPRWMALLDGLNAWLGRITARPERPSPPRRERPAPAPARRAAPPKRPALEPPPPLEALPVLRLAPLDDAPRRQEVYGGDAPRRGWLKGAVVIAGLAAAGAAAFATRSVWMPERGDGAPAAALPGSSIERGDEPSPAVVAAAAARLPHLSAETTRLVMLDGGPRFHEAPGVFQRACAAARRGSAALATEEAAELRTLEAAVRAALPPDDRARLLAYERGLARRDRVSAEDERMLELYARGVYTLAPPSRQRLQVLLGRAIAAGLAPAASPS